MATEANLKELKILLWESILLTLVVLCINRVYRSFETLTWEVLVLPGIVLVLSIGLYLMRAREG